MTGLYIFLDASACLIAAGALFIWQRIDALPTDVWRSRWH